MKTTKKTMLYPRRRVSRAFLRWVGKGLLSLLTRTEVQGIGHFPTQGPLIVVGNHIAAMEVVLMVVYAPWQMELLGPGDIPPPPFMHAIARMHGYIPINRGNMDRVALNQALGILKQGGILGMFPEGGIWDTGEKPAKRGVAWLSYRSNSPILPIGFGGLEGALHDALRLKHPKLSMHIGEVIPPVIIPSGKNRKDVLRKAANYVMDSVNALIPQEYKAHTSHLTYESFNLHIEVTGQGGVTQVIPPEHRIPHRDALCKMWYRPAILRIFQKDLHLDVSALQHIEEHPKPNSIVQAIRRIQQYLKYNPAFFTYRFGIDEGTAMTSGLNELKSLAQWAHTHNYTLILQPTRRYRIEGRTEEVVENSPGEAHTW